MCVCFIYIWFDHPMRNTQAMDQKNSANKLRSIKFRDNFIIESLVHAWKFTLRTEIYGTSDRHVYRCWAYPWPCFKIQNDPFFLRCRILNVATFGSWYGCWACVCVCDNVKMLGWTTTNLPAFQQSWLFFDKKTVTLTTKCHIAKACLYICVSLFFFTLLEISISICLGFINGTVINWTVEDDAYQWMWLVTGNKKIIWLWRHLNWSTATIVIQLKWLR